MDTHSAALLDFLRQSATNYRAEAEHLVASPAKYLDPKVSVEPSTGVMLYDRVRNMRGLFIKNFPASDASVPLMSYEPAGTELPDGSLTRDDLQALVNDLNKFLQVLAAIQ